MILKQAQQNGGRSRNLQNLKTNPTESTTSKVNKFVDYNRLDVEKIAKELAVH